MEDREWLIDRRFAGMNLGLQRVELLLQKLGNPQMDFPSVHVAGTNGKGTLCSFLSSAAVNSGLKVGLFTTPHLVVIEERVMIDGEVIDSKTFDNHLSRIRAAAREVGKELGEEPTFYECTFAIAMLAFSKAGIDRGIIETGLGGQGDATCLVDADLCVITTIGLDHTEILGNTREEIARAKAGEKVFRWWLIIPEKILFWQQLQKSQEMISMFMRVRDRSLIIGKIGIFSQII